MCIVSAFDESLASVVLAVGDGLATSYRVSVRWDGDGQVPGGMSGAEVEGESVNGSLGLNRALAVWLLVVDDHGVLGLAVFSIM